MARQGGAPPKELAQARAAYFCAACRHGHAEEAVEYLKQLNSSSAAHGAAGLALFDAAGASGLHLAAGNGHAGLVTSILNSGLLPVDVEELGRPKTLTEGGGRPVGSGRTPLHWAASGGHAEVVDVLLKRGAWADATDTANGDTAMHLAVRCSGEGGVACVQLLVSKGAAMTVTNNAGLSPLDSAVLAGDSKIVSLMQRLSPDVPRLLRSSEPIRGTSLLHVAAALGADAGVKLLLASRGVDVNGRESGKGYTPLMMACANLKGMKTLRVARRLLRAGCDPCCVSDVTGESAWSLASRSPDGGEDGAAGSSSSSRRMLCELLKQWGATAAGVRSSTESTGGYPQSELEKFKSLDKEARERQLLRWCTDPSSAPFDPDVQTWKKVGGDLLNFHYTCEDFKLVRALRDDQDFQDDINKKHTRQAIDAIMADPTAMNQWQTHKSAMRVMSKLRRLKSYGIGKAARFPLEYFIVSQMPNDKFQQKEESVAKCKSIAVSRAVEEADCLLVGLKAAPREDGGSDGGPGQAASSQTDVGGSQLMSSLPPIVSQVLQAIAGPVMALLITYVMMKLNKRGEGTVDGPGEQQES